MGHSALGGARGVLYASQISAGEENNLIVRVYGTKASLEWHQEHPNELIVKFQDAPRKVCRRGNSPSTRGERIAIASSAQNAQATKSAQAVLTPQWLGDSHGPQETETLAETENYLVWKAEEPDGETTYHVELNNVTVHFFEEEWQEFLELARLLK